MKRFYKVVTLADTPDGYEIHLDGRSVKTSSGTILATPHRALADTIMLEWATQETEILPQSMPMTQMLTTALDRVRTQRDEMTHRLIAYLNTDLICYRATEEKIAERQRVAWDPWLGWFAERFDAGLAVTDRLQALTQPEEAQIAVRAFLETVDENCFTSIQLVTSLTGSLVFGLAFAENAMSPLQAFDAANVEEIYKGEIYHEELYGKDPQEEKRERTMRADLDAAARFLELTRPLR